MTPGQELALEQLNDIATQSGGRLEVLSVSPNGEYLRADISVSCRGLPSTPEGLRLRPRERIFIDIPTDFPFVYPEASTRHTRFAGFPHVQRKRHLCLYAAPSVEWNVNDGIYGFI